MRLVAIGDSTVEGLEDPGPDGTYIGWADRLAAHIGAVEPDLLYANLAVRGETTGQVRATQLAAALAMRPDIVLVVAGVNDLLRPSFDRTALAENLWVIHSELAAAGTQVVTFTIPDMTRVAPIAVLLRGRFRYLNRITAECAPRFGSLVVDLAGEPTSSHPALWHTDRLHGNAEGHRRVAAAVGEAMGYPTPEWRSDPGYLPVRSKSRIIAAEAKWVISHLLPWAWDRLRGIESAETEVRHCKRPVLTPL